MAKGILERLTNAELKSIISQAQRVPFEAKQEIIREGEPNSSLFIVREGELHVFCHVRNRRVFLGRLQKGAFFGEVSVLDPGPASATVEGSKKGVLLQLHKDDFRKLMTDHPGAAVKVLSGMMTVMAARIRSVDQRLRLAFWWGKS